jgi:hypothetical protein
MWMSVFLLALHMRMFVGVFIFMPVGMGVYNPLVLVLMLMLVLEGMLMLVDVHLFRLMFMRMGLHIMLTLCHFDYLFNFGRTVKHS